MVKQDRALMQAMTKIQLRHGELILVSVKNSLGERTVGWIHLAYFASTFAVAALTRELPILNRRVLRIEVRHDGIQAAALISVRSWRHIRKALGQIGRRDRLMVTSSLPRAHWQD